MSCSALTLFLAMMSDIFSGFYWLELEAPSAATGKEYMMHGMSQHVFDCFCVFICLRIFCFGLDAHKSLIFKELRGRGGAAVISP